MPRFEIRKTLHVSGQKLLALAASPDGSTLYITANERTKEKRLMLWDVATGKKTGEFTYEGPTIDHIAVYPAGVYALTGHGGGMVTLWDLEDGTEEGEVDGIGLYSLLIHPSGDHFYLPRAQHIEIWSDTECIATMKEERLQGRAMAIHPLSGELLVAGADELSRWHATTGDKLGVIAEKPSGYQGLAVSPSGSLVAASVRAWIELYAGPQFQKAEFCRIDRADRLVFLDEDTLIALVDNGGHQPEARLVAFHASEGGLEELCSVGLGAQIVSDLIALDSHTLAVSAWDGKIRLLTLKRP